MNRVTEETTFEAPVRFTGGISRVTSIITSTTPSAFDGQDFFTNDGTVRTVTDFVGGSIGQSISIRGDGNLTIANNTNIKTNTAANKLLAANKVYRFTYYEDFLWIEDA
jgi:hypothetical protein